MKQVELSQGKYALIDDEDYALVSDINWCAVNINNCWYAVHQKKIKVNNRKTSKSIKMHRIIMKVDNPKVQIDHIDGNGLNNQRRNLRIATSSQNQANKKKQINGTTSIYKGVCKTAKGSWRATCTKNKKNYEKECKTEIEAAIWYNEKAKELHGEYSKLNIIEYGDGKRI